MLELIDITAVNERNIDGRIVYPIRVLSVKRLYDDDIFLFRPLMPYHIVYLIWLVYKNV